MSRNKGKKEVWKSQASVGCQSLCRNDEVKWLCQNQKRKEEWRGKKMQLVAGVISLKCSLRNDLNSKSFGLILGGWQDSNNRHGRVSWEPSTQGLREKGKLLDALSTVLTF